MNKDLYEFNERSKRFNDAELFETQPNKSFEMLEDLRSKGIVDWARYANLIYYWVDGGIFGTSSNEFNSKSDSEKMECINALRIIINSPGITRLAKVINDSLRAMYHGIARLKQGDIFLEFFDNALKSNNGWRYLESKSNRQENNPIILATQSLHFYSSYIFNTRDGHPRSITPQVKERFELIIDACNEGLKRNSDYDIFYNEHGERKPFTKSAGDRGIEPIFKNDPFPDESRMYDQNKEILADNLHYQKQIALAGITAYLYHWVQIDHKWVEKNLCPLFYWNRDKDIARIAWNGYLWNSLNGMPNWFGTCNIYDFMLDNTEGVMDLDQKYIENYSTMIGQYMKQMEADGSGGGCLENFNKVKNCYRMIGDENRLFAVRLQMYRITSGSDYSASDGAKVWNRTTKSFFNTYWDKDFESTMGMRTLFEDILIHSGNSFRDAYGYIYDILAKDNNKINISPLVKELLGNKNKTNYLERFPIECFKLLSISVHKGTSMTPDQADAMKKFLYGINDHDIIRSNEYTKLKEFKRKQDE